MMIRLAILLVLFLIIVLIVASMIRKNRAGKTNQTYNSGYRKKDRKQVEDADFTEE